MSQPVVGIAGVGLMGLGIATNVQKAGYRLHLLDHPGNQDVSTLTAAGAVLEPDAAAMAACCDILILCVTGSPQVEDVLTREDGILKGMRSGTIIIDCSTAIPGSTKRMAERVEAAGGRFLDAPMTRTPKEAMEGRLNLIVGGDAALFEEVRPLLASYAENISHVGGVGAGHAMKLLHNFVSLGQISVLAEAAASAARSGIDPEIFIEVLAKGGGGGAALERMRPYVTAGDVGALRFSISNAHKDIGYYNEMANELGTVHDSAAGILAMLDRMMERGEGGAFVPELAKFLQTGEEDNG